MWAASQIFFTLSSGTSRASTPTCKGDFLGSLAIACRGQRDIQIVQPRHLWSSTLARVLISFSSSRMASTGQTFTQVEQALHFSSCTLAHCFMTRKILSLPLEREMLLDLRKSVDKYN